MEFSIKSGSPEKQRSGCVVVGVFEARRLTPAAEAIDKAAKKFLSEILERGDMEGKSGTSLMLHKVPGVEAERVLLIGLGKEKEFGEKEYCAAIATAIRHINQTGATDSTFWLTELSVKKRRPEWHVQQAILSVFDSIYRTDQLKSKKDETPRPLRKIMFGVARRSEVSVAEAAMEQALAIASGIDLAKDLGNLPGNICTPTHLAEKATELAKSHGFEIEILAQEDMSRLGMNTLLSVARGSRQPPKLIVLKHHGGPSADSRPVVLVGKGVTFDSGGVSLKPGAEMDEMKYDMCGAASVLGAFKALGMMKLPLNVIGVIPATENMPDGAASKPGDIVTSMSGQTVEILNTDAEGRLILCDALTYVEQFDPACVVDIATLTGACIISLGHVVSGLLANHDPLAKELLEAGQESYDRVWQLPLWSEYDEQLRSNFADMANIGGRAAGAITAACFLARFTHKYHWAHLDIAGTAWRSGKDKGATGRPVPLLSQFLIARASDSAKKAAKRKRK